jgi:hypothetical protein
MIKRTFEILLLTLSVNACRSLDLEPPRFALAGTWTLTAADEIRPDGTRQQPYGPNPQGLLVIDDDGRYSLQIFRPDRTRFTSGDKRKGTPQEYEAAILGMSSHIGRCSIDPASGTLIFRIERASYPNWDGTEQKRKYHLTSEELTYEIPAGATGDGTIPRSSWRRVSRH